MYKILIIEDNKTIANTLTDHLQTWGYEVSHATDFSDIMPLFLQMQPHLVLLDISLPFYNGYHWCTKIREISKNPIIFISSSSDNMNQIMAMNMGGDDFIAKPFDLNLAVAKIQALLRRTYSFQNDIHMLEHHGLVLNTSEASVIYDNTKINLTKNEFKILQILLTHKGSIVSRDEIMKQLWNTDSFIDDNTLTVNMTRLRKKLDELGLEQFITTKKGLGYLVEG